MGGLSMTLSFRSNKRVPLIGAGWKVEGYYDFLSPKKLFQWKVLNGDEALWGCILRLMDSILGEYQPHCKMVYINVITFSPSIGQHLINLGDV